ncbi:hypothetical protein [Plantactinospora veratri]
MKIVVVGGSGLIGSKVVELLAARDHQAVAASPKTGVNAVTGEGLAEALDGADVVVDVSNSPSFEPAAARSSSRPPPATCSRPRRRPGWATTWRSRSSARTGCRTSGTWGRRWRRRG